MEVSLINQSENSAHGCAEAAAICRNSAPTSALLKRVVDSGHESILEFADFTFKVEDVSRALTHQLVRHRLASYAQQSQRHVKIEDGYWYYVPDSVAENDVLLQEYIGFMYGVKHFYDRMIVAGIPVEDARYVLPNATYSTIVVKMNARVLGHFFQERCCSRAQAEIREMAAKMLVICQGQAPLLFNKTYPDCDGCPEPCGA